MRQRGFEIAKGWEDKEINLPVRKTKNSAGYDIEAAEDTLVPKFAPGVKPTLIPTGVKAYMQEDEVLLLDVRSSMGGKFRLANTIGVVDSTYYNNELNDGNCGVFLINTTNETIYIKRGDRIAQGLFMKYLTKLLFMPINFITDIIQT